MLADRLFIVAHQLGDIRDGDALLQQNTSKRVSEAMSVGGCSKSPAAAKALAIRRRQRFVTVSSRNDDPTMNGRAP